MKLEYLLKLARAYIPGAKPQSIDDTTMTLILNQAALDIAAFTCCLKANKKFDVEASTQEYALSTKIGDYLTPDKSGLWWYNGTKWTQLDARTLEWFDINRPNWRDLSAGTPQEYAIEGDTIIVVPKPVTALSSGFWLYYGKKPTDMSANSNFPFTGSNVEMTQLSIFDDAILKFAKWKIEPMINKDQDANLSMQEYLQERAEKKALLYRRPDIASKTQMRAGR